MTLPTSKHNEQIDFAHLQRLGPKPEWWPKLNIQNNRWVILGPPGNRDGWGSADTETEAWAWAALLRRAYWLGRVDEAEVLLTSGG